jgi:hypothetical protein
LTWLHNFWNFNDVKNIFNLTFLVIALKKGLRNVTMLIFHGLFIEEDKFETCFEILKKIFLMVFKLIFLLSN